MEEKQAQHLQMIQEPISRLSTTAAIFKGFSATIVAGISMISYFNINHLVLGLSFIPILLFAIIDIYYLQIEKKYRHLYNMIRTGERDADFSMDLPKADKVAKTRIADCIKSPSIWLFYPALIIILAIVFYLKIKEVL